LESGVSVTMGDIYERLTQVERKLDALIAEARGANVPDRLGDHERRLRRVEAWSYAIPAALLVALVNAAVLWLR
jgi:hypothetical protein